MTATPTVFITPEALLAHWQGHRRLTRRVIDAFPDETAHDRILHRVVAIDDGVPQFFLVVPVGGIR